MMKEYRVGSLPCGVKLEGCTVVRADVPNSYVFVKTKQGKIFVLTRGYAEIDLTAPYGSKDKDRSAYARLAGISVKEINEARKARREGEIAQERRRELYTAQRIADKHNMKLVKK